MRRRPTISLSACFSIVLVAAAWVIFAPAQVGGRVSYVIIDGSSMEPTYQRGDLVLVRAADVYQLGDIAAYRHPDIGPVIHRIVAREGSRYVFQGDNNSWRDGYAPGASELIGRAWIRIPRVGRFLAWLREPRHLTILTVGVGVIIMSSFMDNDRRGRDNRHPQPMGTAGAISKQTHPAEALKLMTTLAVSAALLAAVAFAHPLSRSRPVDLPYTQRIAFTYTAPGAPGIYDADGATTGEPIFRLLSDSVDVAFAYQFASEAPASVGGDWRLVAEVSSVNGWRRTLELTPRTSFSGPTARGRATLAFADVQRLIDHLESRTGVDRVQYRLAIVPEVRVEGSLEGVALRDTFAPRLEFTLDDLQLQVAAADAPEAALAPAREGVVTHTERVPNTLALFSWRVDVGLARTWSLATLAACLVAAAALMGWSFVARRRPRTAAAPPVEAIEVRAWADLLALSRRIGAPVQSDVRGRYRRYFVQGDGLTWEFTEIIPHAEASR